MTQAGKHEPGQLIRTSALTAASQTQGVRLYECLILTKLISSKQTLYCKFVETVSYVVSGLSSWNLDFSFSSFEETR